MVCNFPLSSCMCHLTVPTHVGAVAPLNPLMVICDGFGGWIKSSSELVIDLLQQLSTNISYESVSKCILLNLVVVELARIHCWRPIVGKWMVSSLPMHDLLASCLLFHCL